MKPDYKRDFVNSYLILPLSENRAQDDYQFRIISNEHISGTVKCQVRKEEERGFIYYDISGTRSLIKTYETKRLNYENLNSIFLQIRDIFKRVHEHLLEESFIVLEGEYIFLEPQNQILSFILYPEYDGNLRVALVQFAELLLNIVDYQDEKAVELVYGFYEYSKDENFSWDMMIHLIEAQKEKTEYPNAIIYETEIQTQKMFVEESEEKSTPPSEINSNYSLINIKKTIIPTYLIGILALSILLILSFFAGSLFFTYETGLMITSCVFAVMAIVYYCWRNRVQWLMIDENSQEEP